MTTTEPRTWRIEMPVGAELLSANHRFHWRQKARITKQLRTDAFWLAKAAKVPPLKRVHVTCIYQPPESRGVRDVANLAPSAKAAVDGALVDAGVIPDDSDTYMTGPDMRRGEACPGGRLVLILAELPTPE
jgi:hypothetical protein